MKIQHSLIAFSALLIGLTGCSKSSDGPGAGNTEEDYQVYLQAKMGSSLLDQNSKAVTDPVIDGTAVVFNDGHLVFAGPDAGGVQVITKIVEINSSGANGAISRNNLENGVMVAGVPASSNKVLLFANLPGAMTLPAEGDPIANFQATAYQLAIADQTDASFNITKATLYGNGSIVNYAGDPTNNSVKQATFTVSPLISRIEVGSIAIDSDEIAKATLAGIFVNYYVSKMYIDGTFEATDFVNHGQNFGLYTPGASGSEYTMAMNQILYDIPTGTDGEMSDGAETIFPNPNDQTKTWAYNVYAVGVPHVILKLKDVEEWDDATKANSTPFQNSITGQTPGDAWVTVRGFIDNKTGQEISAFEGSKVYRISELKFGSDNLHELPEPEDDDYISVWVVIEVLDWSVVDSDPIMS